MDPIVDPTLWWARVGPWIPRGIAASFVLIVAWAASRIVHRTVEALLRRGRFAATHLAFFAGVARWAVLAVGFAIALDALGLGGLATGVMAGGGVTAVVLGFAFREIGENLLAGVLLAFSRPFQVGDYVRSGEMEGRVRDLDLRTVHIRTADGRDVWIPNAQVVNQPFVNFTVDGLRRPSFDVGIDYADDPQAACAQISEAVAALPDVLDDPAPRVVVAALDGSWVTLRVSLWVDTTRIDRTVPEVLSDAMIACRAALRGSGVTLSCDTTTAIVIQPSGDPGSLRPAGGAPPRADAGLAEAPEDSSAAQ